MISKAEISRVRSLADKRSRVELGLFLAEGSKLVGEILSSSLEIEAVYATDRGFEQLGIHHETDIIRFVSNKEMERLSLLKTPSSALALVRIPRHANTQPSPDKLILALDRIQDPGNLGTIVRLADWFGIEEVVCSEDCVDCFSPKVIQATMGAILRVRIRYTPLAEYLTQARCTGIEVYGTFLEGDNIYDESLSSGGIIVMGNEGSGVCPEVEATVSRKLYIPPFPPNKPSTSESLNVAIATAVICSEFRRQVPSRKN